jgi:PAS domain S-box-containing protein
VDVLFLTLDRDGRILNFPPSAERLTGHAAAEMLGADPFEKLFAEDGPRARAAFLSAPSEHPTELVDEVQKRDGHTRLLHWFCWRDEASVHEPVRYVVVGIDRTAEQALKQQAVQDARLAAAGAMAAGLAHEIRNPLNGAGLHLSVLERELLRGGHLSAPVTDALGVVRTELGRLSSLLTDFLEVARPRPLARAPIDLNDVVRRALMEVQDDAKSRKIRLVVNLPSEPVVVRIDCGRYKQALLNLVQNAIEAVEREGTIVVRVCAARGFVELEVEDDGPGVPDGTPPIFDAFFTTKRNGTGLGLSIVHRIAADHGGDVTYTSVPRCTAFKMRVPINGQWTSTTKA